MKKFIMIFALLLSLSFTTNVMAAITAEKVGKEIKIIYTAPGLIDLKWLNVFINGVKSTRMLIDGSIPGTIMSAVVPLPSRINPPYKVTIVFEDSQDRDLLVDSVVVK